MRGASLQQTGLTCLRSDKAENLICQLPQSRCLTVSLQPHHLQERRQPEAPPRSLLSAQDMWLSQLGQIQINSSPVAIEKYQIEFMPG